MGEQLEIYDSLMTLASFVFGVMGAWLALIYPDALKNILDPNFDGKGAILRTVRRMLYPMAISILIIALSLGVRIGNLIGRHNFNLGGDVEILRGSSFAVLVFLSLLALISLLFAIAPGVIIDEELSVKTERHEKIQRMQNRKR